MLRFKGFEISVELLAVFISESRFVRESESDIFTLVSSLLFSLFARKVFCCSPASSIGAFLFV